MSAAPNKSAQELAGAIKKVAYVWGDEYTGSTEALIAAGIIKAEQLPGQPGGPKERATYYDGVLRSPNAHTPTDERYLRIYRPKRGKKIAVQVGVSDQEQRRRVAAARPRKTVAPVDGAGASADEYYTFCEKTILFLWRLAIGDGRPEGWAYPFVMTGEGAERLKDVLRDAMATLRRCEIVPWGAPLGIEAARKDEAFQSFLRGQCIANEDSGHA